MNERIFELARQADILFYKEHIPDTGFVCEGAEVTKEDLQRFAELIVRECAQHLNSVGDDYASIELLEHFGVEE